MENDFPQYLNNGKDIALFCLEEDWVKKAIIQTSTSETRERFSGWVRETAKEQPWPKHVT